MATEMTPEKAASTISSMLAAGTVSTAQEAVEKEPALKPGLQYFEEEKPVSQGSGSMATPLPPRLRRP